MRHWKWVGVAILGAPGVLPAGEMDATVEEVIVRAAPLARGSDELTQPTVVLRNEELLRKVQQSIGETLAGELGVSASYFGPVAGRPVIRGQGGPRVSVLEHGIGALDVSDLSPDHAVSVEPLLANAIEIIRGPSTLLYGSSATGGVVNVLDGRIAESLPESPLAAAFELRGDTGSEERTGVARLDGRAGRIAWHLDGFNRETNDVEIPGFATDDPNARPEGEPKGRLVNSFGESQGYAVGTSYVADRGYVGASYGTYQNNYGLPGPEAGGAAEEDGPLVAAGPFIELDQSRVDLRGEYRFDGVLESVRLRAGRSDYEHVEIEPSGAIATTFENEASEMRLEAVHAPVGGWRGAIGVQLGDRDFSARGDEAILPKTQSRSQGLFVIEEREFSAGRYEFGARLERSEHDPQGGLSAYDDGAVSVAGGVVWDFAVDYDLAVNVARSERHPAVEELYSNGPHLATGLYEIGLLTEAGSSVDREVSYSADVALHHHSDRLSWEVSLFYNRIDDYIVLDVTDDIDDGLPVAVYRQMDADLYGFEAEVEVAVTDGWNVRLFTDYVRGKTDDGDLPRIQPMRVGAEIARAADRYSARLGATWHAEQDDVSSYATDAYTLVSADVIFDLFETPTSIWQLFLRGTNLLDEEARRSTSFRAAYAPLPGISLLGGVRVQLSR
jgi:iron complex outermembrane receptor protein